MVSGYRYGELIHKILITAIRPQMSTVIPHNEYATELFEEEASAKDNRLFSPVLLPQDGHMV